MNESNLSDYASASGYRGNISSFSAINISPLSTSTGKSTSVIQQGVFRASTVKLIKHNNNENTEKLVISMGGLPGELNEELVMQEKQKKGWRMNCDIGEATEGLENEL